MVYEKYIEKNGKIYGPYVYKSRRVNGKVVSEYHGQNPRTKAKNKRFLLLSFVLFVFFAMILTFYFSGRLTGKSIIEMGEYDIGTISSGSFEIILKNGELIPSNSTIIFRNNDKEYSYKLGDLINEKSTGTFFLEGANIEGNGEGIGKIGTKETTPLVFFKLKSTIIPSSQGETEEPTIINESAQENTTEVSNNLTETKTEPATEEIEPQIEEVKNEEVPIESAEVIEEVIEETPESESQPEEEAPVEETPTPTITGNVVSNNFKGIVGRLTGRVIDEEKTIQGEVTKYSEYVYDLAENEKIELVEGSVNTESSLLTDSDISMMKQDDSIIIKTNYSIIENGFGEEYVTEEITKYKIDFRDLEILMEEGTLEIEIIYGENTLSKFEGNIQTEIIKETNETSEENETIQEIAEEIFNITNETILMEKIELTASEKEILKQEFKVLSINSTSYSYRDKIIVEFKLENHFQENIYDADLSKENLEKLIERDKILWLKDLASSIIESSPEKIEIEDSSSLYPII